MQSANRAVDPMLLDEAQKILRKRFSEDCTITSAVYLSEPERRNIIVRIVLHSPSGSAPTSVILKQSLPVKSDKFDAEEVAENKTTFSRFSRDWAGLEFASSIPQSTHNVPFFYGAHHHYRFILIEDLGHKHVSLVDSLLTLDRDEAVSALERYMKALGSFHAASFGYLMQYNEILRRVNPDAETQDAEMDGTSKNLIIRIADVYSSKRLLSVNMPEQFGREVQEVIEGIYRPGSFTVLTHGDIAPDNVFDHKGSKGLQLIDFEWCGVRNALLDGVYLRMSIPTGWCAKTIPEDVLTKVERIYRDELSKAIPDAGLDNLYATAYTQACAFHALQQIASIKDCLEKNEVWGSGPVAENLLWKPENNFLRSRVLTRLQTFINVATENNMYPAITQLASVTLVKVKKLWPDAKPLDMYPAFSMPSLKSEASSSALITKRLGGTMEAMQIQKASENKQEQQGKPSETEKFQEKSAPAVECLGVDTPINSKRTPSR